MINPITGEITEGPADPWTLPQYVHPKVFLRTPYNYDMNAASDESGLACPEPTKTQQQFKDEADINTIVERFGLTGQLPEDIRLPQAGDFTGVTDYQSAMNAVIAAEHAFMELPAGMRQRFQNSPQVFAEFFNDEANRAEAERLGFLRPRESTPGTPAAVTVGVPPTPPQPAGSA